MTGVSATSTTNSGKGRIEADSRLPVKTFDFASGFDVVEAAERLVCALYAVPPELTDEVVAHAVARAAVHSASSG